MNKHGKHGQFAVWDTASKIWRLLFLLTVFIAPLSGNQVFATTYDDFSSGSVQTYKWQVYDTNGFLSVAPGSFQPYVLHLSGNGSTDFQKVALCRCGHLVAICLQGSTFSTSQVPATLLTRVIRAILAYGSDL